jgi:hypothetical protein
MNETKWRTVWLCWLVAGVAAEVVAIRSRQEHAPLSHHLRSSTYRIGKTTAGQVALVTLATWLHRHLYNEAKVTSLGHLKNGGQSKSPRK